MTSKVGIKNHRNKAKEAFHAEFMQLHDIDVFLSIKKNKLSKMQRKNTLRAMSVIKEKRDGALKGSLFDDGRN